MALGLLLLPRYHVCRLLRLEVRPALEAVAKARVRTLLSLFKTRSVIMSVFIRFVDRWAQDTEKKSAQDIALEKKVKYSLAHFKRQNPFSQTLLTAAAFNSYPAQFPYVSPGFCSEQPYSELRDGSRATSKLAGSQTTARAMGRAQTPTIFSGSASQRARSSTSPRSGLRARLVRSRILLTP